MYTNIFQFKALQNLTKLQLLVSNIPSGKPGVELFENRFQMLILRCHKLMLTLLT
jgi:hypothetical protein